MAQHLPKKHSACFAYIVFSASRLQSRQAPNERTPMIRPLQYLRASLAGLRSQRFIETVYWDEVTGAYEDTSVFRGFPLGNIGTGGLGLDTAGGFTELRINNNWMAPVRKVKGWFWAASCEVKGRRTSRILRRHGAEGSEYKSLQPIHNVTFLGRVPSFEQSFKDRWPLDIEVQGFAPLIPHNVKDSSLPLAHFDVTLTNTGDEPMDASFLFSMENILGMGGTGQTGVKIWNGLPARLRGRLKYDEPSKNSQAPFSLDSWQGIESTTQLNVPENSHQQSTLGRYFLLCEEQEGFAITASPSWDASKRNPPILREFAKSGRLPLSLPDSNSSAVSGNTPKRPAAALCASGKLEPGESKTLSFVFCWWTPNHVVEKHAFQKAESGKHDGVRVGKFFENSFQTPEDLIAYSVKEKARLHKESTEIHSLILESSLPPWLQHAMINTVDSVVCNTVLPKDGNLYTLEGMDWEWFFGGLTGTNDQRLSSQPYTANLFPELDFTEIDAFRKLHKEGSVPHGNGNCDLALGDSDVPYGEPLELAGALAEKSWPDLTLSYILQFYRHYKLTGNSKMLKKVWPDLKQMLEHLQSSSKNGVPVGGSTFDTSIFRGAFIYTATLMSAALEAMTELAKAQEPDLVEGWQEWKVQVKEQIDSLLWRSNPGYYKSCESKDTLFLGSFAGDWFARYAGLPPVLEPERVQSHIEMLHEMLLSDRDHWYAPAPFPYMEATPKGKPVPTKVMKLFTIYGYAWQVVSYHGLEAIYTNLVKEGLDTIRLLFIRMWKRGWPWSADLFGNAGAVYMTHPVLWALPNALTGAFIDKQSATLSLSPRMLPDVEEQSIPVFFPQCWLMIHTKANSNTITVEVRKHFGETDVLKKVRLLDIGGNEVSTLEGKWQLKEGNSFLFTLE